MNKPEGSEGSYGYWDPDKAPYGSSDNPITGEDEPGKRKDQGEAYEEAVDDAPIEKEFDKEGVEEDQ